MSDDRLFASNNAIGRKWYFLNIIILAVITYATGYLFDNHVFPNIINDAYFPISKGILYIIYCVYIITLLSLIDRRLFDSCGTRSCSTYKNVSLVIFLCLIVFIFAFWCRLTNPELNGVSVSTVYNVAYIMFAIFVCIAFVLIFPKGKISTLSFEEYAKKSKYE